MIDDDSTLTFAVRQNPQSDLLPPNNKLLDRRTDRQYTGTSLHPSLLPWDTFWLAVSSSAKEEAISGDEAKVVIKCCREISRQQCRHLKLLKFLTELNNYSARAQDGPQKTERN